MGGIHELAKGYKNSGWCDCIFPFAPQREKINGENNSAFTVDILKKKLSRQMKRLCYDAMSCMK